MISRASAWIAIAAGALLLGCEREPPPPRPPATAAQPAPVPPRPPAPAPTPSPPPPATASPLDAAGASADDCSQARPEQRGRRLGWPERPAAQVLASRVAAADVVGVVVERYAPPPCPLGALCKPTPPPHLRLADPSAPQKPILNLIVTDVSPFQNGTSYVLSSCVFDAPLMGSLHGRVRAWRER